MKIGLIALVLVSASFASAGEESTLPGFPVGCINKIVKTGVARSIERARDEFGLEGNFKYTLNQSNHDERSFVVTVEITGTLTGSMDIPVRVADVKSCKIHP